MFPLRYTGYLPSQLARSRLFKVVKMVVLCWTARLWW